MADSKWKEEEDNNFKKLKKKKRKAETREEEEEQHQGPFKSSRAKSSLIKNGELKTEPKDTQKHLSLELGSPWMNLHLILLLQNKEIDTQRSAHFTLFAPFLLYYGCALTLVTLAN